MTSDRSPATPSGIATLFPGYFALVMATGIIATGFHLLGVHLLAEVLYGVAVVAFSVLFVMNVARLIRYPQRLFSDLTHHNTGFLFLTLVTAVNVLASGAAVIFGWWAAAEVGWIVSLVLWAALIYPAIVAVIIGEDKPPIGTGMNGTWFLLTVSTESIAVTAALLLTHHGGPHQVFELASLAAFTVGLVLYLIVMTMLFLRWTFTPLGPDVMQPPSWIAAGAVAISVLAGSNLLTAAGVSPRVERLAPFIEGMVIMAWGTATFWFPVMISIGVWRHLIRKVPITYNPAYWALVFPIGMYGVSTYRMIAVTDLTVLEPLPEIAVGAALVAWSLAFSGLIRQLAGTLRHR